MKLREEFGSNPDIIDEKSSISLGDALEKVKPFLTAYAHIWRNSESAKTSIRIILRYNRNQILTNLAMNFHYPSLMLVYYLTFLFGHKHNLALSFCFTTTQAIIFSFRPSPTHLQLMRHFIWQFGTMNIHMPFLKFFLFFNRFFIYIKCLSLI